MASVEIQAMEPEKMSLNIHDQVWLKKLFDLQDASMEAFIDESLKQSNELVYARVAQVLAEQNSRMVGEMTKHTNTMANIEKNIAELVRRMENFEKRLTDDESILIKVAAYSSNRSTVIRIILTIVMAVSLSLISFLYVHAKLK